MIALRDRIEHTPTGPILRGTGVAADEIGQRLESGEAPARLVEELGIDPTGFVAALSSLGLGPEDSEGPALIQGEPRRPGLVRRLANDGLAGLWPDADRGRRLALTAGLLQVLDGWEASHEAAQAAD